MKLEAKHLYMALPVGLLLMSVTIQMTAMFLASEGNGAEIEKDYYDRAVNWDDYQKQVAASRDLGWKLEIRSGAFVGAGETVSVVFALHDRTGEPVTGLGGYVDAFQNGHVDEMHHVELVEGQPGIYAGNLRPRRYGHWVWRYSLERAGQLFVGEMRAKIEDAR